jgi:hypothetical protein
MGNGCVGIYINGSYGGNYGIGNQSIYVTILYFKLHPKRSITNCFGLFLRNLLLNTFNCSYLYLSCFYFYLSRVSVFRA